MLVRAPVLMLGVIAALLRAQDPDTNAPTPRQLLEAKLAQPFLQRTAWTTDWDVARQRAAERSKLILGYFTTAGY